jgi:hypothetical protein
VVSLHERICIDDAPIPSEALDALVARHAPAVEAAQREAGGALSHFEVLTALAFKHFQEEAVEVAVIEAGLGGARDATNVLPAEGLRVAVVTAVGMDHADALGAPPPLLGPPLPACSVLGKSMHQCRYIFNAECGARRRPALLQVAPWSASPPPRQVSCRPGGPRCWPASQRPPPPPCCWRTPRSWAAS